jgi:putative ABC transport system permease protein
MNSLARRVLMDLRDASRSVRQTPLFTTVVVLSMAFGIGANTTVFTLVDQVLLRAIPVSRPAELVQVSAVGLPIGGMGDGTELSYAMYRALRDHNAVFSGMFCRMPNDLPVRAGGQTEQVVGELVSGSFFSVLGVHPAAGRLLTAADDEPASDHGVAVLAYGYWRSRFGESPSAIGQTVHVNGYPLEIVGVAQAGLEGIDIAQPAQIYVPITMEPKLGPAWLHIDRPNFRWVQVYGRMRAGITTERVRAELEPLYRALLQEELRDPSFDTTTPEARGRILESRVRVESAARGHSGLHEFVKQPLLILTSVAAAVLLIVCANIANLLIARGAARRREVALRLALGASRRDVIRLLVAESLLLAFGGAAIGLLLAARGADLLLRFYENPVTRVAIATSPDLRIVAFTTAVALVTAMMAAIVPAVRTTSIDTASTLKSGGWGVAGEHTRLRKSLVVAQVALSFVLLIGAGLFVRTVQNLLRVDPGFQTDRVLSFMFDLARSGYAPDRARVFAKTYAERLSLVPGVSSVAYSFQPLLEGGGWGMNLSIEGYRPKPGESAGAISNAVSPGFFRAMGIRLLAGREFTERDDQPLPKGWPYRVAVVNEAFARRYFDGASPIGRHIGLDDTLNAPRPIEIIGLVQNTHAWAIREDERPQLFVPYLEGSIENVSTYIRTQGDPTAIVPRVRAEIGALDPQLAIYNMSTLRARAERSVVNERVIASLSAGLATMATLLAIIGLYGVMTYTVTRRTREIGIRIALGALASQVARAVIGEAAALVALGLGLGLVAALWLGRYVQTLLYGVTAADPATITIASVALMTVAVIAALIPARRAARVVPMTALRQE